MPTLDILIIDDDKIDREAVIRHLRTSSHHEFSFHQAVLGAEALVALRERQFDCVFLDYLLPDMDGLGFLKEIYNPEEDLAQAPIVMLTGQGDEGVMLDALRLGAQDYLVKGHMSSDGLHIAIAKVREIFELKRSRKKTQDQLHQIHKLELIGQLSSGVAHDFGNLLTVIMGNTRLLQKKIENHRHNFPFDDAAQKVQAIETAARMGGELITSLMAYSRQRPLSAQPANINESLHETLELLRRILGESIQLHLDLADNIWPVTTDVTQFGNAIINIAVNARDAMPAGGQLTIKTGNVTLDDTFAHENATPGPYVMVSIKDTGLGMSKETIACIFEPFFTTKPVGQGTGLGLAMVYGFVSQSGGYIDVHSEEGCGTTFTIFLPKLVES